MLLLRRSQPGYRLNAFLVSICEGAVAGCVALRRIDSDACEMKRMFVYPKFRGKGVGGALGHAIVRKARSSGYSVMRLDVPEICDSYITTRRSDVREV